MINLNSEAISDIGCNIATGIAIESIVNSGENKGKVFLNAYTLYRNFVNCIDGSTDEKIKYLKNAKTLNTIMEMFLEDTNKALSFLLDSGIEAIVYTLDYKQIAKFYKDSFKSVAEFKGLKYFILSTQDLAVKKLKEKFSGAYVKYGIKIDHVKNMFIITHIGLDLLPLAKFKDVNLVESHTGEIKPNVRWYSKLKKLGDNDMSSIPFNEATYRVFGDNTFIKPIDLKSRRKVYDISKDLKWYQGLSSNKVVSGISKVSKELSSIITSNFRFIF